MGVIKPKIIKAFLFKEIPPFGIYTMIIISKLEAIYLKRMENVLGIIILSRIAYLNIMKVMLSYHIRGKSLLIPCLYRGIKEK